MFYIAPTIAFHDNHVASGLLYSGFYVFIIIFIYLYFFNLQFFGEKNGPRIMTKIHQIN